MVESHLHGGRQDLGNDPSALKYGISITDACMSWEETEEMLTQAHKTLAAVPVAQS
jgi:3-deoxy-7-phosphoheptulonate synthase